MFFLDSVFLFALFDSLAVLPSVTHTHWRPAAERNERSLLPGHHKWILDGRRTHVHPSGQHLQALVPFPSLVLPAIARSLHHSLGASVEKVLLACSGSNPWIIIPSEHSLWVCQYVIMESVCVRVCVCMCLVIVLYAVALLVSWSIKQGMHVLRHLGK